MRNRAKYQRMANVRQTEQNMEPGLSKSQTGPGTVVNWREGVKIH